MSTTVPPDSHSTAKAEAIPAGPSFEQKLQAFWEKNARLVYIICGVVLLAIVGRGAFEFVQAQRRQSLQADYAAASTPEKLKAFAGAHRGSELAGVAHLRLADDAYAAGNYAEAAAAYQRAVEDLPAGLFAGRARLGAAVSKINAGQPAEAQEPLKQIANDATQTKPVRAEAAYHLAVLAADAGRVDEAGKYLDLIGTIDPSGFWAQRAYVLRASLVSASPATAPGIQLPGKP